MWVRLFGTLTLWISLVLFFQNCSGFHFEKDPFRELASAPFSEGEPGFASAQKILNDSCVSCHSASGSAAFAPLNFATEADFVTAGLVVPGDPTKSKLLFRLKNYPTGDASLRNMPIGSSLTDAQYQSLFNWVLRMGVSAGPFACNDSLPAESKLVSNHAKRLNSQQYKSTLNDLLNRFLSASETSAILNPAFNSFPLPLETPQYKSWDNEFSSQHTKQFFGIADTITNQISANSTLYNKFVNAVIALKPGNCTTVNTSALTVACQRQFIRNLGLRVYRRPLVEEAGKNEVEELRVEFLNAQSMSQGMSNVVFRMLMNPDFLLKLEVNELPGSQGDVLKLSSYALASRLSYSFWSTMPDERLFELAATTNLQDPIAFDRAVNHVFSSPKITGGIRRFMTDWLKLEKIPTLSSTGPTASLFTYGATVDANTRLEMIDEIGELANFVAANNLSFKDLYTTDISFARSPSLMKIYGMTQAAPANQTLANALRLPTGTRSGLLTRAALQVGHIGDGSANPVTRGLMIRKEVLCLDINQPPPELMTSLVVPPSDSNLTIRNRYHNATSSNTCNSCHKLINPFGFALSNYNGYGFFQNMEPAFNADGSFANKTLPVDARVDLTSVMGPGMAAETPAQFSSLIAEQPAARRCFSEAFAKATLGRDLLREKDGCRLNRLYNATSEGVPLKEFLKSLALDPEFKLRKVSVETN